MAPQAHECAVPADAHGARAETVPEVTRHVGHVLQGQAGAVVGLALEPELDPAGRASGALPGRGQAPRRFAGGDRSACVALELVAAAQLQVAGDRQEPSRDPIGICQRVPEVLDRGVIDPAGDHNLGGPALVLQAPHLAQHHAHLPQDVVHLDPRPLSGLGYQAPLI